MVEKNQIEIIIIIQITYSDIDLTKSLFPLINNRES